MNASLRCAQMQSDITIRWIVGAILAAVSVGLCTVAQAQVAAGIERNGTTVAPAAAVAPTLRDSHVFSLPPLSDLKRSEAANGAKGVDFTLTRILVTGNRLLKETVIEKLKAPYLRAHVTLADVAALRDEITKALIEKGYMNSGAVVDSQDVTNGELTIRIVEGHLSRVNTKGLKNLSHRYIEQRLHVSDARPLDILKVQRDFQLLLEDRNIDTLNARLVPGELPGASVLEVEVKEKSRYNLTTFSASDRSPTVGDVRAGVRGSVSSIIQSGDVISAEVGRTRGLLDARFSYSTPLLPNNLTLNISVQGSSSKILERPLNALDATSKSLYESVGLSLPVWASPGRSITLTSSLDHLRTTTALLGTPYSFSQGSVGGVTDYGIWRTGIGYSYFTSQQSYAVNATLSRGIAGKAAAFGVDKNFSHLIVSGEFIQEITRTGQRLIVRGEALFSKDKLYSTEMISIGGADSVRGYRQNADLGSEGYWTSIEYQAPLSDFWRIKSSANSWAAPDKVRLGAFFDAGHVKKSGNPASDFGTNPRSVGLRAIWSPVSHIVVDVYAAKALRKPVSNTSFQDQGFGFNAGYKF